MAEETTTVKKIRSKKTVAELMEENVALPTVSLAKKAVTSAEPFTDLIKTITQAQIEFDRLEKEIAEMKVSWLKEQTEYQTARVTHSQQDELNRKREEETYQYNLTREHKRVEDEFADKKATWEKALQNQQESLAQERKELEELRKLAGGFEVDKEKAVQMAGGVLEKELTARFETETKLKDQQTKAEKDLLNMRITNLTAENSRQVNEIEVLKKALEEATHQIKDIAVKVIESNSSNSKIANLSE